MKETYVNALAACPRFKNINSSDIEQVRREIQSPKYKSIVSRDPTDPDKKFVFVPFWTQMVRLNQTHFHNHSSIFHQNLMFNMPDFSDKVISNLQGKLR